MTWDDGKQYLEEMAPGVYAFVQPDGGWMVNNCGVITDASGDAVIVDTTSTEKRNRAFLAEVAGVSARDPKIAVNTHSHPDHTYGNGFLPPTTTIIGHHLCREGVLRAGLAATKELPADYGDLVVRAPDVTIDSDIAIHLEERPVELTILGPAHTSHDIGVWLPEEKVLFAGDLAFAGGHPIFLDGSMLGFKRATQRMRELAPEVLLPGHGPVRRGEQVLELLDRQERYVDWIAAVAAESYAAGLTPLEAAQKALHSGDHPYAEWPESERVVCNLHRAYAETTDYRVDHPLNIPNLWSEMVALNGGQPIETHA